MLRCGCFLNTVCVEMWLLCVYDRLDESQAHGCKETTSPVIPSESHGRDRKSSMISTTALPQQTPKPYTSVDTSLCRESSKCPPTDAVRPTLSAVECMDSQPHSSKIRQQSTELPQDTKAKPYTSVDTSSCRESSKCPPTDAVRPTLSAVDCMDSQPHSSKIRQQSTELSQDAKATPCTSIDTSMCRESSECPPTDGDFAHSQAIASSPALSGCSSSEASVRIGSCEKNRQLSRSAAAAAADDGDGEWSIVNTKKPPSAESPLTTTDYRLSAVCSDTVDDVVDTSPVETWPLNHQSSHCRQVSNCIPQSHLPSTSADLNNSAVCDVSSTETETRSAAVGFSTDSEAVRTVDGISCIDTESRSAAMGFSSESEAAVRAFYVVSSVETESRPAAGFSVKSEALRAADGISCIETESRPGAVGFSTGDEAVEAVAEMQGRHEETASSHGRGESVTSNTDDKLSAGSSPLFITGSEEGHTGAQPSMHCGDDDDDSDISASDCAATGENLLIYLISVCLSLCLLLLACLCKLFSR